MMGAVRAFLGAALITLMAPGAFASPPAINHSAEYSDCMRLVADDPRAAYDSGLFWVEKGGGRAARHCVAAALVGLGQYTEAAARLERLAQEATEMEEQPADLVAGLLSQAAQAWLLSGRPGRAAELQGQALALRPSDPNLWIDRAVSRISLEDHWAAIDDLSKALDLAPRSREARLYRATAHRYVGALDLARDDLATLLRHHPDDAEALLERGILRQADREFERARADFLAAIQTAPNGDIAEAARARLEALSRTR